VLRPLAARFSLVRRFSAFVESSTFGETVMRGFTKNPFSATDEIRSLVEGELSFRHVRIIRTLAWSEAARVRKMTGLDPYLSASKKNTTVQL
jgi:hypothetical protein